MFKQTQRSFAGGWLDRELMGRTDLAKYYTGASKLENFLVRRQGNLAKRRGTGFCAKIKNILGRLLDLATGEESTLTIGNSRLVPLVYEREVGYYALLTGRKAFIVGDKGVYCSDKAWRRDLDDYFSPSKTTGMCTPDEAECFVEDIPYATLKAGMTRCPPGRIVKLAKDVTMTADIKCRGILDLNGHVITVTNRNAQLIFYYGTTVGLIDSAHTGVAGIVWDVDIPSASTRFISARSCDLFLVEGVTATFPLTGDSACFAYIHNSAVAAQFDHCKITTAAGHGIAWLVGDVAMNPLVLTENDFTTTNADNPMFHSSNLASNARKVEVQSGYYTCAGTLFDRGSTIRGGAIRCASLGGYTSTTSVVAGLLSYKPSSSIVASGSEYKGVSEDPVVGGTLYNYNLTSEGEYVYSRDPIAPTPPVELGRTAPYSIDVPYEDGDLAALDTYQSGDTIFFAHKNYPPAKMTFKPEEMKLDFEVIEFNATTWKRPRITEVTSNIHPTRNEVSVQSGTSYRTETTYSISGGTCTKTIKVYTVGSSSETLKSTTTSTLPVRTVRYVVTYVKDGIESAPSNPVSVTYGAPWEQGGVVKLTFDKGDNEKNPDFYNVYKKEYSDYGLVGSTVQPVVTDVIPELADVDTAISSSSDPWLAPTGSFNGKELARTDTRDVLSPVGESIITTVESRIEGAFGSYQVFRGVGGAEFASEAKMSFGAQSSAPISSLKVWFDTHEIRYVEDDATGKLKMYDRIGGSGKRVTAKVTYRNKTGDQTDATQTVTATLSPISYTPEGGSEATTYSEEVEHYCGAFDPGISATDLRAAVAREPRYTTFAFTNVTASKQVVSIEISCEDEVDDGEGGTTWEAVTTRICGMEFDYATSSSTTFEDDYITPDMSIVPPSQKASFRGRGNYPSCVGIYQQRLIYAATRDQPATFWMSATGDLYTFAPHPSIREDDALEVTLAATEFPDINHIVMGHDIIMFGDGGEWKIAPISGNTISYKTISATLQSSVGSAKWLKPIIVGNEIVFAERTGSTIRSVSYNYVQDGYDSQDLTVLAGSIFAGNPIERMCYKQHPDSTLVCVLKDGTIAALVYMREHEVVAWSHHTLGGEWLAKDVATCKALDGSTTNVMLTVRKGDEWELWTGRPDSSVNTVEEQSCLDSFRVMTGAEAAAEGVWQEGWIAVDLLTGKVAADAPRLDPDRSYAVGYPIRSELVTVRPEPSPDQTIQFEVKNLKSVEARTIAAGKYAVRSFAAAPGVKATAVTSHVPVSGGAVELACADVATTVMGSNTGDGRVQLVHEDVWPMELLQLSANYEMQPLSGSEG